jgi:hypothetical protein
LVGRDTELARLEALFETASGGRRQLVFITGEPGIGKTTLVEAFLARLDAGDGLRIGRGQCVEQYGTGEAYLPVPRRSPAWLESLAVTRSFARSAVCAELARAAAGRAHRRGCRGRSAAGTGRRASACCGARRGARRRQRRRSPRPRPEDSIGATRQPSTCSRCSRAGATPRAS